MPSPRPASNRAWCKQWDRVSSALVDELQKPDCEVARVIEIIRERRRLTTANPVPAPGDLVVSEEEQRAWLENALERERAVSDLVREVQDRIARSLLSLKAGRRVRDRFDAAEAKPKVFSTRV